LAFQALLFRVSKDNGKPERSKKIQRAVCTHFLTYPLLTYPLLCFAREAEVSDRRTLQLLDSSREDFSRAAPLVAVAALPFVGYAVIALTYFVPILLPSILMTPEQFVSSCFVKTVGV